MNRRRPHPAERKCCVHGCPVVISVRRRFCSRHWRAITPDLRAAILRAAAEGTYSQASLQAGENAQAYLEQREPVDMLAPAPAIACHAPNPCPTADLCADSEACSWPRLTLEPFQRALLRDYFPEGPS